MRLLLTLGGIALAASLAGCPAGEVTADLSLYLANGNLDYYEEVVFPSSSRETYDAIFADVPLHLPLHLTYETTQVDALITQRGDLQITAHLQSGGLFTGATSGLEYLNEPDWNGESEESRYGEALYEEITGSEGVYAKLDEDIRLILLVNLPAAAEDEEVWSSDGWEYPTELWANYQDVWLDDDGQEHDIAEDDIQLMSRMIIGGELFETINGWRFDEELGYTVEDESPHVLLESLIMPGEDGRFGSATGSFDLMLEADSFAASSGVASISGEFDVDVHSDRWALDDLDVQEDLEEPS